MGASLGFRLYSSICALEAQLPSAPHFAPSWVIMATCPICLNNFSSKQSLAQHKYYFQENCSQEMTPEEHGLLEPVEGDYCKVQCKVCDKKMSKRSVFAHLKQHNPEFVEASWEWVVKKDYNLMKTRRQNLIKIHLSQILGPTMLQVMKHHQNQMMQRNNWLFTMQPQQHQCLTKRKLPHHHLLLKMKAHQHQCLTKRACRSKAKHPQHHSMHHNIQKFHKLMCSQHKLMCSQHQLDLQFNYMPWKTGS